ncbi:MAG: hypothetical protein E7549_00530 [Ruminococcaceae bacterium]|nr:hypothetical protein [Oscillospiraceae bacterium]
MNIWTTVIIPILTIAVTSVSSLFVAKMTAKKEVQKMYAQWHRDDIIESRKAFAEMVYVLSSHIYSTHDGYQKDSVKAVASFAAFVRDRHISSILHELTLAVHSGNKPEVKSLLLHLQEDIGEFWEAQQPTDKNNKTKRNK